MDLIKIFRKCESLIPWSVMVPVLQKANIDKGLGWIRTIDKIKEVVAEHPDRVTLIANTLTKAYRDYALYGNKSICYFPIISELSQSEIDLIRSTKVLQNDFSQNYPFSVDDLKAIGEAKPELLEVNNHSMLCEFVFCTVRSYDTQIELDLDDIRAERVTALKLEGAKKITAKKEVLRQFYDIVEIDFENNIIQLRMDIVKGYSEANLNKAILEIRKKLAEILKTNGIILKIDEPMNLFPMVEKSYKEFKDCQVCELSFTTEAGSVKSEKMRRNRTDLRDEAYHKGGIQAVHGNIAPYRIAMSWEVEKATDIYSYPELMIPGKLKHLSDLSARLPYIEVSRVSDYEDYKTATNKVETFVINNV